MQAQDAATAYFFKIWEWVETNLKIVIVGAIVVVIAAVVISYYFWRQNETEVTAAQALTQLLISTPPDSDAGQLAGKYLEIARNYAGTRAGGRALALGAATLFTNGKYADARKEFQTYLSRYPNGPFAATAALGVASSLEAQQKTNLAATAYQRLINSYSDPNAVNAAKFALAGIDEKQGKLTDAESFYEQVARNNRNSPLASEAALHAIRLREQLSATSTSNRPPASFKLTTQQ